MPVRLASNEELPYPLQGYRLLERLGRGGFGEVWKVEAPGGLLKAAKFVFGDLDAIDDDESRPAEQELKAIHRVKSIRHPYILSLERFDKIEGQLIIVMELADRNLWDRFRECRQQGLPGIPREELLRYMDEAAEALDFMNNQFQIQHLDVKPQNIFLVHNHIKVADFGLAKDFEGDRGTITGGVTPVYAAPETFEGSVSRFTDQYSLGIVYQELLTGRRPFDGANTKQLLMQHLNGQPDLSPLPEADRSIIGRSLAKKPSDRWPNCTDLARALRQLSTPPPYGQNGNGSGAVRGSGTVRGVQRAPAERPRDDTPSPMWPSPPEQTARPRATVALVNPASAPVTRPAGGYPTLTTPRLVTPQAASGGAPAPMRTQQREQIVQTGRMSSLGIAPPERAGDGVLMPAIVVGVGQTGLDVLRALRRQIRDEFGSADAVPCLRFLYIDTDAEACAAAAQEPDALAARDVVVARMNRPTHYLQESVSPNIEQWMPPGLLYRLPKNPGPAAGVRAFGRLALCDHYRTVAQRVRQEVETFLTDDVIDKAAADTGLGFRSNRVRVYVVAGLAGGTGSGMALDLAYILKQELRAVGYRRPEAVGVLLAPPADGNTRGGPAANAVAALTEIRHFSAGHRYQVKFDGNEAPITDGEGPFSRLTVLPLPRLGQSPRDAHAAAARGVYHDLLTPVGRVTDYVRSVLPPAGQTEPCVQTYGLSRLAWPRAELLRLATGRFATQLLGRWAGRDTAHLKEPLAAWLDETWSKQRLVPEMVFARLHAAAHEAMSEDPEAVFEAAVDTLRTRTPGAGRMDAGVACQVLEQLLKLVGKPVGEPDAEASLVAPLLATLAQKIAKDADTDLATLAVSFIEQPQYRLAGSEEALNQLTQRLKETIEALEQRSEALGREVVETYARIFHLIGTLGSQSGLGNIPGRKASLTGDLLDTLRAYPTKRLGYAEMTTALSLYRGLLGNIPEYLREVNFCRARLAEMGRSFAADGPPLDFAGGKLLLPQGCATLEDAAAQLVDALPPADMLSFDQGFQKDIARKFRGLASVCVKAHRTGDFVKLLSKQAGAFLDERLESTDPATVLLRYHGDGAATRQLLRDAHDAAAPGLGLNPHTDPPGPPLEATILGLPLGEAAQFVQGLAAAACPGVEAIPAPLPGDIVFYRELPQVPMSALALFGPTMQAAYRQQCTGDASPHTRADVPWVPPAPRK